MDILFNAIGTLGVVLLLVAYFLAQKGKILATGLHFPVLNFFGALLVLISLFWDWNLSAAILEMVWIAVSLYGIFNYYKNKKNAHRH